MLLLGGLFYTPYWIDGCRYDSNIQTRWRFCSISGLVPRFHRHLVTQWVPTNPSFCLDFNLIRSPVFSVTQWLPGISIQFIPTLDPIYILNLAYHALACHEPSCRQSLIYPTKAPSATIYYLVLSIIWPAEGRTDGPTCGYQTLYRTMSNYHRNWFLSLHFDITPQGFIYIGYDRPNSSCIFLGIMRPSIPS